MATDIARAFFVGRLTREVDILYTSGGGSFGVLSIAVKKYQGKENPEKTSFFRVTIPEKTVNSIGPYLVKGRQVAIDAVPVMNSWTDDSGNRHSMVEFKSTSLQLLAEPQGASRTNRASRNTRDEAEQREEETEFLPGFQPEASEDSFIDDLPF